MYIIPFLQLGCDQGVINQDHFLLVLDCSASPATVFQLRVRHNSPLIFPAALMLSEQLFITR